MREVLGHVLLLAGTVGSMSCGGTGESTAGDRPPNVVVVLVDDLRWDDIGIAGHPFVETPAIDELAREGTRFRNAFATTPLCSPSRAAILTGQYAHTNGIIDNTARDSASHRLQTFAVPLADEGRIAITRSPGFRPCTSGPQASITPAVSSPGLNGSSGLVW
jgi:hypothetical protein